MNWFDDDEVWGKTLEMWKWIVGVLRSGRFAALFAAEECASDVYVLKRAWLSGQDTTREALSNCLFCEAAFQRSEKGGLCSSCPGRQVDPEFDCQNPAYYFEDKPEAFYAKLLELNGRRIAGKEVWKRKPAGLLVVRATLTDVDGKTLSPDAVFVTDVTDAGDIRRLIEADMSPYEVASLEVTEGCRRLEQ